MQVETYQIEETADQLAAMAADSEACELVRKLGLLGQEGIVNVENKTRVQFRRMTLLELAVFETLFPEKTKVQKYDTEIIPLRVLQLLDTATAEGMFCQYEVWHSRTRKDDPILVGYTGELKKEAWGEFVSGGERFLMARWGEALIAFADLAKEAKAAWLTKNRAELKSAISEKQQKLANLEELAELRFTTGEAV